MALELVDESASEYRIAGFTSIVEEGVVQYWRDYERRLARIVFNAPDHLNSIPVAGWRRLVELIREAELDDEIKVIVFAGNGDHFGTGANAGELGKYIGYGESDKPPSQLRRLLPDRDIIFGGLGYEQVILRCPKVTIAEVQGYCYGAHYQVALAADIVVCSPDASFVHPAWRYLGPVTNFALLTELIGLRKAKEMVLTARPLPADEALDCGFVTRVVERDRLTETVDEYVQALSAQSMDGLAMGKSLYELVLDARGVAMGETLGSIGHAWITNLKLKPGEFNFLKSRRDKGITGAVAERDAMVPPYFRMGKTREPR